MWCHFIMPMCLVFHKMNGYWKSFCEHSCALIFLQVHVEYNQFLYFLSYKGLYHECCACLYVAFVLPSTGDRNHSHVSPNSICKRMLSSNLAGHGGGTDPTKDHPNKDLRAETCAKAQVDVPRSVFLCWPNRGA